MSKEVYCGGVNTGCHHEDKPTVEECSDCPYMTKAQLAHKSRPDGCPFCNDGEDYDLIGLKYHLSNYCEAYQKTEVLGV